MFMQRAIGVNNLKNIKKEVGLIVVMIYVLV